MNEVENIELEEKIEEAPVKTIYFQGNYAFDDENQKKLTPEELAGLIEPEMLLDPFKGLFEEGKLPAIMPWMVVPKYKRNKK